MLRGVLVVAAVSVLAGCRTPTKTNAPTTPNSTVSSDPTAGGSNDPGSSNSNPGERPMPRCDASGKVWDGHHDGCLYEVQGCCYDDPASACTAAGCDQSTCRIMEVAPAQIVCDPTAPTS